MRRDGEDEDGQEVHVCNAGMGTGGGEVRSSGWRMQKGMYVSRGRGQRWSIPCMAGCHCPQQLFHEDFLTVLGLNTLIFIAEFTL